MRDTDGDVDTGLDVKPGQMLEVAATGTIVAPEILAGDSDASGWNHIVDDARFALHSVIDPHGARKYALLGRLNGYFFVGSHMGPWQFNFPRERRLYLRVNNDDHLRGAGKGAFDVKVTIWDRTEVEPGAVQVVDILQGGELTALAWLGSHFLNGSWNEAEALIQQGVGMLGAVEYNTLGVDQGSIASLVPKITVALQKRAFSRPPRFAVAETWAAENGASAEAARKAAAALAQTLGAPPIDLTSGGPSQSTPYPARLFLISSWTQ
ncbi:hypothetical protein PHK61_31505 [Actinomycetospora lutea]|uniref:hypothetical protein n=1 Tax=Actinomycetospora lutea TaxID=663604 RepID=UPI002365D0BA|nr:hypothetical protein [Actinomycetospora lutea]MDD7942943.1 hypothetical protein [Actinomycetospora lutea]